MLLLATSQTDRKEWLTPSNQKPSRYLGGILLYALNLPKFKELFLLITSISGTVLFLLLLYAFLKYPAQLKKSISDSWANDKRSVITTVFILAFIIYYLMLI
jgi:uncharacterized membrane protein YdbT with pleckstrin-like domain